MDSWEWLFMQPEGQNLDRKGCYDYSSGRPKPIAPKDLARKVAEDLVAMANSEGGVVAIGIEDDGRLSGVPASYNLADFRRKLEQLVMPRLHFHIEEVDLRGMRVWVAEVDWSTEVHQLSDGRCLYRRNDQSLPFPVEDVAAIKRGRLTRFYEQQVVPEASLRDIDADLVEDLARRAGLNLSLEQTLMHYRLAVAENGRVQLRLAALLLFAKDPLLWHPRCGIDFAVWRGTRRQTGPQFNVVKRIHIEQPLLKLIQAAYETIQTYIPERQALVDLFFGERFVFPQFAWQEAIVNAVAHRDYSLTGIGIEVDLFDDRLEVRSPGELVTPVTIERLQSGERVHASRNPYITRVLTDYGYMRDRGEGIPRMREVMEEEGLRPPEFRIEGGCFVVTLYSTPVYSEETIRWLKQFEDRGLSRNQKRLLAYAHERADHFTSKEYQKLVNIDPYIASQDIRDLVRKGIVRLQKPRGREYVVTTAASRGEKPESLIRLMPLLEKQGYVTNKDIREVFGVTLNKANRIARRLVDTGWLSALGDRRGRRYILKE